jgi:hypothetical protein
MHRVAAVLIHESLHHNSGISRVAGGIAFECRITRQQRSRCRVDGITSGPPGGTLTFTGLDMLALGTVNGSINLTSDISFQDLSVLAMYARGAGSDLTLDSPISNFGTLDLAAEGSIQLTNPGTMSVGEFMRPRRRS